MYDYFALAGNMPDALARGKTSSGQPRGILVIFERPTTTSKVNRTVRFGPSYP